MYLRTNECIMLSFLPSVFHFFAIILSNNAWVQIGWAVWWGLSTTIARVASKHVTVYKRSPAWWETMHARFVFGTTCASVLTACDIPYAWCGGLILLSRAGPKRVAFIGMLVYGLLGASGIVRLKSWPLLVIAWVVAKQWSEKERCDPEVYWLRRSLVTLLHQEIKWCLWCEWVFPHEVRWDVSVFSWVVLLVIVVQRMLVAGGTVVVYKFASMPADHVPAPSLESALACPVCKRQLHVNDEERVYDKPTRDTKPQARPVQAPTQVPAALRKRKNPPQIPRSFDMPAAEDPYDFI